MKINQILEVWDGPSRPRNKLGNRWGKTGSGSARGDDGFGGWLPDEGDSFMDDNRFDWIQPGRMVSFELQDGHHTGKIATRSADGVKVNFFRGDEYRVVTFKNPKNLSLVSTDGLLQDQGVKEFNEKLARMRGTEPEVTNQPDYVPVKVPFDKKDVFKNMARGSYQWNPDKKTWMIKSVALTPAFIQQLKTIGVTV